MTLQYRTRDMSDDRRWNERIRLTESLLHDMLDWWCRGDHGFPIDLTVASVLYLFSDRCNPFSLRKNGIKQRLFEIVRTPAEECGASWGRHPVESQSDLIQALTTALRQAVERWTAESVAEPPVSAVVGQLAESLVKHKYVVFHRTQNTRRDGGGFHGLW